MRRGTSTDPSERRRETIPSPPIALHEGHRNYAEKICLAQPVSAYASVLKEPQGNIRFSWPGDLVIYYQCRFFEGRLTLVSA